MRPPQLCAPEPLTPEHDCSDFDCAHPSLTSWLKDRAKGNERSGSSRTFVVADAGKVVAYYCLASGALDHAAAPGGLKRNQPNPIPIFVLGRLAVDRRWSGRGLGADLLRDAVLRCITARQSVGSRALLCHAIDENAKAFYLHHGFVASPTEPLTMMISLEG